MQKPADPYVWENLHGFTHRKKIHTPGAKWSFAKIWRERNDRDQSPRLYLRTQTSLKDLQKWNLFLCLLTCFDVGSCDIARGVEIDSNKFTLHIIIVFVETINEKITEINSLFKILVPVSVLLDSISSRKLYEILRQDINCVEPEEALKPDQFLSLI